MPSSETRSRVSSSRTASGSAPAIRSRAPVRRRISGQARSRICSPFRGSCRPAKTTRCSRPPGSTPSGMSTPFGTISYSPGSQRCADARACSETAIRRSSRSSRKPHTGVASRIQPRSPLAWCVPTIGPSKSASAAMQGVGVIGSCRWRMSNLSRASTRLIRGIDRGLRMMFGSEPFAGTITDRPIGITSGGGCPCRPTRGCSARVNCPGGSLPITRRTSWPSSRKRGGLQLRMLYDRAPEGPREGDDDAHFHLRTSLRAAAQCTDAARRCPPRHADHRRRAAQRRLLHPRAGAAAREEDGQPGRPDRLPPLLRRREGQCRGGHHLLRVPGRDPRQGGSRDDPHDRLAGRLRRGARLLGAAAGRARRRA